MATRQDSSDPTGVADTPIGASTADNDATAQRDAQGRRRAEPALSGATWGEIAEALGYPTPRQALLATEKALVRQLTRRRPGEDAGMVAGARLERLLRGVWTKAIDPPTRSS